MALDPIFPARGDISVDNGAGMETPITAAANDFTGIGASNSLVFTAGVNGGGFRGFLAIPSGTNVASAVRFFANNGATNATATNNLPLGFFSLPATTAGSIEPRVELLFPFNLKSTERVYAGLVTAVAAGWTFVPLSAYQY
jgi:hypothetical protein